MMIYKVIKGLRIFTVCLIVFLALDYFLHWGVIKGVAEYNKDILLIGAILFFATYLIASWIMIFARFKYMNPGRNRSCQSNDRSDEEDNEHQNTDSKTGSPSHNTESDISNGVNRRPPKPTAQEDDKSH
jgi:hypothetical protein